MKIVTKIKPSNTFPNKAYKELYHQIERWLKRVNPCKVCNGKCLRGQSGGENFCCGSHNSIADKACEHCGKNGCTADRPLTCRLWLCYTAESNLTEQQKEEWKELKKAAGPFANGAKYFRATRQDAKKLYNSAPWYRE